MSIKYTDLFENPEDIPAAVTQLIEKHFGPSGDDFSIESCASFVEDLRLVGFSCDYSLDGIPFGLVEVALEQASGGQDVDFSPEM
jgi:hypothetical protein